MTLRTPTGDLLDYTILQVFPFTSESKRMGIIVRVYICCRYLITIQEISCVDYFMCDLQEEKTGQLVFYLKGADVVMSSIVQYNDWLEEECGNMAREGLRTLVVAKKVLTEEQYIDFEVSVKKDSLLLIHFYG